MKHQRRKPENSDPIKELVIHRQDPTARRVYDKETKDPQIQVFTGESLKGEDSNKRYCVECGGSLVRFPNMFSCNSCGLSIEDKPDNSIHE